MSSRWTAEVLDSGFLRSLDRLVVARRRSTPGAAGGSTGRSPRASGLDWVDHRPYEPGDDLRYLDWNLFARIGRPFVRRFLSERAERLDLLVDASRSMLLGRPPKRDVGCALAFVFGYIALSAGERVGATFFADRPLSGLPARRGPAHLAQLLDFLVKAPTGEKTGMLSSLGSFAASAAEIGKVIVISDLLDEATDSGLAALRRRGFEVGVVRLRSAGDEKPACPEGSLLVLDIETGARRRIAFSTRERERYHRQRLIEAERTRSFCADAGIALAMLESWRTLPDLVFRDLRHAGLLD